MSQARVRLIGMHQMFTGAGTRCSGWSGYACYSGVSCPLLSQPFNSATSITVTPGSGCGSSGIGFNATGNGLLGSIYKRLRALGNAMSAATSAGKLYSFPPTTRAGFCPARHARTPYPVCGRCYVYNPNFTPSGAHTQVLLLQNSGNSVSGCTLVGQNPTGSLV